MGDLTAGEVYASGQEVNPKRLNDHVNNAVVKDGAITYAKLASAAVTAIRDAIQADVITASKTAIYGDLFPVGAYWITESTDNPATRFGVGTWAKLAGRMLIGSGQASGVKWSGSAYTAVGTDFAVGAEGGTEDHALTEAQMPEHGHTIHLDEYQGADDCAASNDATDVHLGVNAIDRAVRTSNANGGEGATINGFNLGDSGSGSAHNNLPPWRVAHLWRRTA